MLSDTRFLTTKDMADVYCVGTAEAFRQRYRRDRLRPPENRRYPEATIDTPGRGNDILWSPLVVSAHLHGKKLARSR